MRNAKAPSEQLNTSSHRFARWLVLFCSWMMSCDRVPQVRLEFRDSDLAELDTVEFELLDSEGTVIGRPEAIGVPDDHSVNVTDLLPSGTVSLYLNPGVRLPLDVSIHYLGRRSGNCKLTEGVTDSVRISDSGQSIAVPMAFPPKLTLGQRAEKPSRPGLLGFAVSLEPTGANTARATDLCPSKRQPDTYYVPKGHKVRVDVSDKDTFTVFDGWDDQECPSEGSCSNRRTETIAKDTALIAKFVSWNCMQPDSFCELDPKPGRYQNAIAGVSAMSGWVAPNKDVWVVGHRGLPMGPNVGLTTMIKRWTGSDWIHEDVAATNPPSRRCWDVMGNPSAKNIFVACEDGVFQYTNGRWQQELASFSSGGIWVGDREVWAAGGQRIAQRALSTNAPWSDVNDPVITGLSTSLHAIAGNDNGSLIATGRAGTILQLSRKLDKLEVANLSVPTSESIFSAFWHKESRGFYLSAQDAIYVFQPLSQTSSVAKYDIPPRQANGLIFGTWVPPSREGYEVWNTGSYGITRRCLIDPNKATVCTDIPVLLPQDSAPSLRVLIGPNDQYLWAVGYERQNSAQINLLRYCPANRCTHS